MRKLIIKIMFLAVNDWFALGWTPPSPITPPNTVPDAVANMNFGVIAGGAPADGAACTPANDSVLVDDSVGDNTIYAADTYKATKFSLGSTTNLTEFKVDICDNNVDTGSLTASIRTDNGGEPSASDISGTTKNVAMTGVADCNDITNMTFTLDSTKEDVASGTYWLVIYEEGGSDAKIFIDYTVRDAGDEVCTSEDGSTWSCSGSNYMAQMQILGCQ